MFGGLVAQADYLGSRRFGLQQRVVEHRGQRCGGRECVGGEGICVERRWLGDGESLRVHLVVLLLRANCDPLLSIIGSLRLAQRGRLRFRMQRIAA